VFLGLEAAAPALGFVASPAFTDRALRTCSVASSLNFKIPFTGDSSSNEKSEEGEEKKIGMSGLLQLITAGMGSPFLGDFEGVDEETGRFMFSLEANNLTDENGNSKQTSMPYFENGWVDPEEAEKAKNKKGWFNF